MTIVINAIKSGSWTDPTVWSVGRVPMLGDEVHANASGKVKIGKAGKGVKLSGGVLCQA